MTKLLDQAIKVVRQLAPEDQDNIARALIQLAGAGEAGPVPMTADERVAVEKSKAAAARGEFASEAEVKAVWAKHRR